jgi:hypothetical protein
VIAGATALIGSYLAYKTVPDAQVIGGLAIIIAVVIVGYGSIRRPSAARLRGCPF